GHEVALEAREVQLAPHVAVHEQEAGPEHDVDETDEDPRPVLPALHPLLDGEVAVAHGELEATERRVVHLPGHLEVHVGPRRSRLVRTSPLGSLTRTTRAWSGFWRLNSFSK